MGTAIIAFYANTRIWTLLPDGWEVRDIEGYPCVTWTWQHCTAVCSEGSGGVGDIGSAALWFLINFRFYLWFNIQMWYILTRTGVNFYMVSLLYQYLCHFMSCIVSQVYVSVDWLSKYTLKTLIPSLTCTWKSY